MPETDDEHLDTSSHVRTPGETGAFALGEIFEDRGVRGGALADLLGRVPEFEVPDVLLHRGSAAVSWGEREVASVRERKEILPKLWQILSCLCATMPEESAETEASLQRHARI